MLRCTVAIRVRLATRGGAQGKRRESGLATFKWHINVYDFTLGVTSIVIAARESIKTDW